MIGLGVHRAGLTIEERHEVEDGFKEGKYLVLLSTPTLEMGIDVGDIDVASWPQYHPATQSTYRGVVGW
ncbi:helicase-related protein [Vulcanisaeta souniana]|uniref:helicase-related protein n=1 Tax=Vulcanisaeta souniana TaxID=164452 RepID=UPI001FB52672|nr:helicase-related protein [Vulcanisaeta souniana]